MTDAVTHPGLPFANDLSAAMSSLPPADRAGSVGLSIPCMLAWTITKAEEHHRYALALHFMQNALAPRAVHRLPAEVLSKIFIEAWQDRKSLRLTHVCRLWRSLLLDTPQFWAIAVAGDEFRLPSDDKEPSDEDYLAAACVRSASRTLSLCFSSLSSRGHLQLIELADRITSLRLSTPGGDRLEWLWKVLRAGMPRLEDLAVCLCDSTKNVARPHGISPDKLPRLTRLTLPAPLFPFSESWRLKTIQEIILRSDRRGRFSHRSSRISFDLILECLEHYPNLRALEIDDEAVVDEDAEDGYTYGLEFATLKRLRIAAHPGTVAAMLTRLTVSLSTYIDLEIISDPPEWDDDDRDEWFVSSSEPWPHPDPFDAENATLDAIVAQIDQVTIENGPSPTVHGYIDGAERFRIRYVGGEYNRARENELSLVRLFISTNTHVSHVLLTTPPRPSEYSSPFVCPFRTGILAAFPHLTHLSIHSPDATCFLASLSPGALYSHDAPSRTIPSFSFLEDITLGLETPLGHDSIAPLRRHDTGHGTTADGVVARDFRDMCRALAIGLAHRVRNGYRLSRFEFFSYEEGCMAESDASLVSHIDLAALHPELVQDRLKTLNVFVDGPVVFSGYHFFTHAPELPARMY